MDKISTTLLRVREFLDELFERKCTLNPTVLRMCIALPYWQRDLGVREYYDVPVSVVAAHHYYLDSELHKCVSTSTHTRSKQKLRDKNRSKHHIYCTPCFIGIYVTANQLTKSTKGDGDII